MLDVRVILLGGRARVSVNIPARETRFKYGIGDPLGSPGSGGVGMWHKCEMCNQFRDYSVAQIGNFNNTILP